MFLVFEVQQSRAGAVGSDVAAGNVYAVYVLGVDEHFLPSGQAVFLLAAGQRMKAFAVVEGAVDFYCFGVLAVVKRDQRDDGNGVTQKVDGNAPSNLSLSAVFSLLCLHHAGI